MRQWLILACVVLLGAATPARAWCEATCAAPASESTPHCPSHDPADGIRIWSASSIDECPVNEVARPSPQPRLVAPVVPVGATVAAPVKRTCALPSFAGSERAPTTVFEGCIPLRI